MLLLPATGNPSLFSTKPVIARISFLKHFFTVSIVHHIDGKVICNYPCSQKTDLRCFLLLLIADNSHLLQLR